MANLESLAVGAKHTKIKQRQPIVFSDKKVNYKNPKEFTTVESSS